MEVKYCKCNIEFQEHEATSDTNVQESNQRKETEVKNIIPSKMNQIRQGSPDRRTGS